MSRSTPLPAAPRRTASLYVRLSVRADEENLSKEGMVADVEALAAREGLRVVAVHVDDGLSGAIRNRPEFIAWLDDARDGHASTLIAWHVDRMTREGVNVAAMILDTIEGKDPVTGRVVRAPVRLLDTRGLDSASDETSFRIQFVIKAEFARAERERMRDRSRARMRRLNAAGRFAGGTVPFGFRAVDNPDGAGRVLDVEPDEAAALRRAAERMIAGDSRVSVVRKMNREGLPPRRAASWSRVTLGQAVQSDAAQALIFTPSENRAIAQALAPRKPGTPRGGRKPSRLLSGVLLCAGCGSRMIVATQKGRGVRYRCSALSTGKPCEATVVIAAEPIEAAVTAGWLDGWGRVPETIVVRPVDESADALAEVLNEIDVEGLVVVQTRGAERAEALARLEALEARRDELEATPLTALTVVKETGRTYAGAWAFGDLDDRRELLLRTVGSLSVRRGISARTGLDLSRIVDAYKLDPAEADEAHGLT